MWFIPYSKFSNAKYVRVFKVLKNCNTQDHGNGKSKENLQKPTLLQSAEVPNCIIR